jgi:hypothetical protein
MRSFMIMYSSPNTVRVNKKKEMGRECGMQGRITLSVSQYYNAE